MQMWMPYIHDSIFSIWINLKEGSRIEERPDTPHDIENIHTIVHLSISYDGLRIFGFLDNTGFRTIAIGIETCRIY